MSPSAQASAQTAGTQSQHRTVALAAMAGTTIEWYDFFIYALCTGLVFGSQFFDGLGEDSLVISFATIGISFFSASSAWSSCAARRTVARTRSSWAPRQHSAS
ncbi:hypothetical protein M2158_005040 [Streptomyces sp. SAI-144]|uniref:hypothetical protein n=1 Tax=Streptomyces sp. SAI-144 TaxID=2940544 RepID=UPI002472FA20|nr:hypothetical protein [Streptomyces sp. SAI-144]MDH6436500.1 hypothetical protein [Streptomyces sp. SAI-144]